VTDRPAAEPAATDNSNPSRSVDERLPEGTRFIGPVDGAVPAWPLPDAPDAADIASCVACGLCLPHCPTYRLTGEESASPRGRIAAMRAVQEGRAEVDGTFAEFMDLCLSCRACEHVCPSHVPFGRLMEHARTQVEPRRPRLHRFLRWLGLEVVLPRGWMVTLATVGMPLARPFVPARVRALMPRVRLADLARRLPRVTEPPAAAGPAKGTVAILSGCVQDRWYRRVNRATIAVLARAGWRVAVPEQACCGALAAHNGRLERARAQSRATAAALGGADWVVVNGAGCGAHLKSYGELIGDAAFSAKVRDFMEFLDEQGVAPPGAAPAGLAGVAVHDACHLYHAQAISAAPRNVLGAVPGLTLAEVADGDRCCGAAGLYNVLEPRMADELGADKAAKIDATGADAVAVANPGCAMQIAAGLAARGSRVRVLNPAELLDEAYAAADAAADARAGDPGRHGAG
jgi:glycolate oxidase iron-sulfur subunit